MNAHDKKQLQLDARRKLAAQRLKSGAVSVFRSRVKPFILLAYVFTALVAFEFRDTIFPTDDTGLLAALQKLTLPVLVLAVAVIGLLGLLAVFGTPPNASRIRKGLSGIFSGRDGGYANCPIYLSRQRVENTEVYRYTFYSDSVTLEMWNAKREAVALLLRGHIVGEFGYGGRSGNDPRYIVVHTGPGAIPSIREAPLDPYFQ